VEEERIGGREKHSNHSVQVGKPGAFRGRRIDTPCIKKKRSMPIRRRKVLAISPSRLGAAKEVGVGGKKGRRDASRRREQKLKRRELHQEKRKNTYMEKSRAKNRAAKRRAAEDPGEIQE